MACKPHNPIIKPNNILFDSVYTTADFRRYGDYYHSNHQIYAIDLLSEGLTYDSVFHISGSGCNLYLSDVFVPKDSVSYLPRGLYKMDSLANDMTFLRGMDFEGNITGSYLLSIQEDQIQKIILFTGGTMSVDYIEKDIILDFHLYTEDSTLYHATYTGAAIYR